MLKEDWKQNSVLILFCFLLREYLTTATLGFVLMALILMVLNLRPNKLVRNILALTVFASYWITYGKLIDPEIGINFLTSIITLKILEKDSVRDQYMIFFGLILLISAGSLFEKTLTYVLFFTASFFLLITDFYSFLNQKWKIKDAGLSLLWVIPLTFILFFMVPRMINPIPFQQNTPSPGEIGYTPDVNISEIESLAPNEAPVFQVILSRKMKQNELYWRGNTLSFTDGWNWRVHSADREDSIELLGPDVQGEEVRQTFRLFQKPEFFFSLDYPVFLSYGRNFHGIRGETRALPQKRWEWVQRYEVYSDPGNEVTSEGYSKRYLQVPFPKKVREDIRARFKGQTLGEITASVKEYFLKEKFSYSLAPGKSGSLEEFLEKKSGFCSHYASALALILRMKDIPSRLVSGYMGGEYNRFADFYLVTQNDAHVWVEAYSDGKWQKIDPTEWVAPDRVQLGGEAFMESVASGAQKKNSWLRLPPIFNDLRMWFGQWDFHFYRWLEEMDYYAQEAWFTRLNFKRAWVFTAIPLMMVAFMLMYMWYLSNRLEKESSPHHELWNEFVRRMKKRGIILSLVNIEKESLLIHAQNDVVLSEIWKDLIEVSFQGKDVKASELMKRIRRL